MTGRSIAKQSIRILGYINDTVQQDEKVEQDDIINSLYIMHKLNPACAIITCPVTNENFFYVSENCQMVLGYSPKYVLDRFRELENYLSRIHESDVNDVYECMEHLEAFLHNQLIDDAHKLRTVLHYRFRQSGGNYVYLHDERATLISAAGSIINYSLIRVMPEEATFSGVKMEIFKDGAVLEKLDAYKPSASRNRMSKRENELVFLIKKGLSTKEIAGQLNISHNTVRNIKSKLFEKYSVSNTIELLNMTA